MTDLSPQAQATWEAYERGKGLAAALRALADQVVPDEPDYMRAAIHDAGWWDKHDLIRAEILAIAAELDPESPTP